MGHRGGGMERRRVRHNGDAPESELSLDAAWPASSGASGLDRGRAG